MRHLLLLLLLCSCSPKPMRYYLSITIPINENTEKTIHLELKRSAVRSVELDHNLCKYWEYFDEEKQKVTGVNLDCQPLPKDHYSGFSKFPLTASKVLEVQRNAHWIYRFKFVADTGYLSGVDYHMTFHINKASTPPDFPCYNTYVRMDGYCKATDPNLFRSCKGTEFRRYEKKYLQKDPEACAPNNSPPIGL